jgi:hypothetical protein
MQVTTPVALRMRAIDRLLEVRSQVFQVCEAAAADGNYSPPELSAWQSLTHAIDYLQKGGA